MDLIYENKKIDLNISKCIITDNIQCKADTITVSFADNKNECRTWDFKKGHSIIIKDGGYSTGRMFVDSYGFNDGIYTIKALSIKKKYKTIKNRSWENITFKELAEDIANDLKLKLEMYGVNDTIYKRVEQVELNNLQFLKNRCILEGYILKVTDEKVVIISEEFLEQQKSVRNLSVSDFRGKPKFECNSSLTYGGCEIIWNEDVLIKGEYLLEESNDSILKVIDTPVYYISEAQRYSKNILRYYNKNEITGTFIIDKDTGIAAGSTLNINGIALFNGKYVIDKLITSILDGQTKVHVRKVLEGY